MTSDERRTRRKSGTAARTDSAWSARLKAALDAGLSRHQAIQALRVASIPKADFEATIESDRPPTVTALAELGTRHDARLREAHHSRRVMAALRAVEKLSLAEQRELIALLNSALSEGAGESVGRPAPAPG